MKKTTLLSLALLFIQISFSQVGIGTTNPSASSALEIRSTNSGLLIPRVALNSTNDVTTILAPAISLLVYNTSTINDVTPGFYFWEGSWKTLKGTAGAASGWNLTGNTVNTTDYLGTNNFNPLLFKVNNNQFSKYHPLGGISIGNSANANDNNSVAIGTSANASASNQAIAIGPNTIASGFQSTALGFSSTASNNSTIALGISSVASGFQSIGIGMGSISNTNNSLSIGNGSRATGQQALSIGFEANSTNQNSTAIGYQAIATQANSIILGSSLNANNKVGIGTNTPDERLHVGGSVKIVDGTQANNYVLTSDANGRASWKDVNNAAAFGEINKSTESILIPGVITFGTNGVSANTILSATNIRVLTTGIYRVSYTVTLRKNTGAGNSVPEFFVSLDATEIPGSRTYTTLKDNNEVFSVSTTKLVSIAANQLVFLNTSTAAGDIVLVANGTRLSVELIK